MMHFFFQWYSGAIWSNLLASALWATPAIFWGKRHVDKKHRELRAHITAEHQKSRNHLEKLVVKT